MFSKNASKNGTLGDVQECVGVVSMNDVDYVGATSMVSNSDSASSGHLCCVQECEGNARHMCSDCKRYVCDMHNGHEAHGNGLMMKSTVNVALTNDVEYVGATSMVSNSESILFRLGVYAW